MQNIYVQFQDSSGTWKTTTVMDAGSSSMKILMEMQNIKQWNPDLRVRTIDENGRIIDFLP